MISLRLSTDSDDKLNQISKNEKISKSEIVKRALVFYFKDYQKTHSTYDLRSDLFGKYGGGDGTLSQNYKNILKGNSVKNILVDAGPLIVLFDKDDKYHTPVIKFLKQFKGKLITTFIKLKIKNY